LRDARVTVCRSRKRRRIDAKTCNKVLSGCLIFEEHIERSARSFVYRQCSWAGEHHRCRARCRRRCRPDATNTGTCVSNCCWWHNAFRKRCLCPTGTGSHPYSTSTVLLVDDAVVPKQQDDVAGASREHSVLVDFATCY